MMRSARRPSAVAYVRGGTDAPNINGQVQFYQEPGSVLVVADIAGLPQSSETGFFGFHIHEGNSCAGAGFPQTGSHYNPRQADHPRHAGDLPPPADDAAGACPPGCADRPFPRARRHRTNGGYPQPSG